MFGVYGGIYRPVWLVVTETCSIIANDCASPGVYITQKNVSKKSAEVTVKVKVDNTTLTPVPLELENAIYDRNGKLVKKHSQNFELTPQGVQNYSSHFRLNNPHLWQGREDPYPFSYTHLYRFDLSKIVHPKHNNSWHNVPSTAAGF